MGCGPSRSSNSVHPLHQQDSTEENGSTLPDPPAAFTRSPEPSEDNPESLPLPPDLADRSHSQWHPLQQRQCQPRWKTDTVSSGSNSGYSAAGNNRTDAAPPPSLSSLTVESGVLRHAIREQAADQRSPVSSPVATESLVRLPSPFISPTSSLRGPSPFISPTSSLCGPSPLKSGYATESQIEFFKMLDKRINDGPDYVSDSEDSR